MKVRPQNVPDVIESMKTKLFLAVAVPALIGTFAVFLPMSVVAQPAAVRPWNDAVEQRLEAAGTNRWEISRAFKDAAPERRDGLSFLVENMPDADLQTLSASFLLENLNLAYDAWEKSPWHAQVTKEMFLNDVLPYASLNEERDGLRAQLRAECLTMIAGAKTPGEAAHLLNQKLFPHYKVKYNTSRHRPDQSPSESIASGKATCTGLSILLVDACRAVGIPARVAGTAMWSNMRGNHTWVEVWDGGWHFTGAAEPDGQGLDHGWFVDDASKAQRDVAQHAIWATSFKRTGDHFPLVWLPGDKSVPAVNVTDRYTAKAAPTVAANADLGRLSVKVLGTDGKRVVADVTVFDLADTGKKQSGQSRGETADLNDFASFKLPVGGKYCVIARIDARQAQAAVTLSSIEQLVTVTLTEKPLLPSEPCTAAPEVINPLPAKTETALEEELGKFFAADAAKQAGWKFPAALEKSLVENESAVRRLAWDAYRRAPIHSELKTNFDANIVRFGEYTSPYTVKQVGTRPARGWPLFIAMHGGGATTKEFNDSQWKRMQSYYADHPEQGGYLYLALRAPNDTWNGFYDDYVYPLIDNLIRQFRLFGDIDPDKVFIMGRSHGGYGAYAIGPKMPDRFAAIHACAAAATDGETTARTLRTTPFDAVVGELDTDYDRAERNRRFKAQVEQLRGNRTDIFPVTITIVPGANHTNAPDRDVIVQMYPAVRNPVPRELDWLQTDSVVQDFFWVHVSEPAKEAEILASCSDNRFVVTANEKVSAVQVLMDSRLVDFSKPVAIELNGSTVARTFKPNIKTLCETLARRGDPAYAFTASFTVEKDTKGLMRVK